MENANDHPVPATQPSRAARTPSRFLFESLLIVLSVVLGFAVTQWRDSVAERRLAARAVADVLIEVQANLAQIEEQLARHQRMVDLLEPAMAELDAADPSVSGLEFYFSRVGPSPAGGQLRQVAWDAAVSSGSLRLVDYEIAAVLSEIYVAQEELYDEFQYQTGAAIFVPDTFDPARRQAVARMLQGLTIEVTGRESLLKEVYERNLPRLHFASATANERAAKVSVTDSWAGEWTGPEGTQLVITGGAGRYEVTVSNLDGPQVFAGKNLWDTIEFTRNGNTELIRATDGPGTGMKWLADKRDCLVIRPGVEGFCRD
jgi:hypothetical protein